MTAPKQSKWVSDVAGLMTTQECLGVSQEHILRNTERYLTYGRGMKCADKVGSDSDEWTKGSAFCRNRIRALPKARTFVIPVQLGFAASHNWLLTHF